MNSKFSVLIQKSNRGEIKENTLPLNHQHLVENNHLTYSLYLN